MAPDDSGPGVVDFEEMAAAAAPPPAALDPAAVKLEGESIPEALRGKSLADVLALQAEQARALEASRDQITALRAATEARQPAPAPVAPPAPQEPPELTSAQLKEMYEKDPFEYNQYVLDRMEKRMHKSIESRVAPLSATTSSAAEAQARQKFKEEFEVLGPEIQQVLGQIPDRSALAHPGAWDQIMYYVRGQHMDKILNARTAKQNAEALEAARQREAVSAGAHGDGSRRGGGGGGKLTELSDVQKEICQQLGVSEADYRQFYIGS